MHFCHGNTYLWANIVFMEDDSLAMPGLHSENWHEYHLYIFIQKNTFLGLKGVNMAADMLCVYLQN